MERHKACLLFTCPDGLGIIAKLASFFTTRKINIIKYEEYVDAGQFFSRLEWNNQNGWDSEVAFNQEFEKLAQHYQASYQVHFFCKLQKLGLFVSGESHALLEIFSKYQLQELHNTEISFVVGNKAHVKGLVERQGIPFYYFDTQLHNLAEYEQQQLEIVKKYKPDVIGFARYMKIVSADFIQAVKCPIVNIHHSFLPSFVGANPYEMAYERGVKIVGATSHFVTPELDQGPIIEQGVARVPPACSVDAMKRMGRDIEKQVFAIALTKVLQHKAIEFNNRTVIFN